ncbi:APG_G0031950.mRNA.1.CDS.1 [Saccharomyces cerevisiae]|nr:Ash1p [Saccharomyces cerevisiae PE-2]CAF1588045.1 Ash1p [Saccharomyces cerevisiae PE-2]CAI4597940.1 APG_G0031950.mRNA.1.CDS.1 [Saccharomyces cerevisiae]CAI7196360.1 APG_G0031950.mRNA.1.CDS.1 [Saccharomyces cerevisiae]
MSSLYIKTPLHALSAGPDSHANSSYYDNLLLPSFSNLSSNISRNNITTDNNINSASPRKYSFHSLNVSPILSPISLANEILGKKSNTAPASPHHMDYNPISSLTPGNSPEFNKASLSQISFTNPLNYGSGLGFSSNSQPRLPLLDRLSSVSLSKRPERPQQSLPSLRHLQLLPSPLLQENAARFPDTSKRTSNWKTDLTHWCKDTNYQDYVKIREEVAHFKPLSIPNLTNNQNNDSFNYGKELESTRSSKFHSPSKESFDRTKLIPSILEAKDQFKDLSNNAWSITPPVTPPMSPPTNRTMERTTLRGVEVSFFEGKSSNNDSIFNPIISEKLVQEVKHQRQLRGNSFPMPNASHKKTNSFKALQIKKLLANRDILSNNSKSNVRKPSKNKISKQASNVFGNTARQLVMKLDNASYSSVSASSSPSPSTPTKSGKMRSRSSSPVRPKAYTPSPRSPNYHRFALDSPPQSPRRSSNSSITKKGSRRSSGSSPTRHTTRVCVSCHSSDSPCWRPSWSPRKQDQLCNSCGLRYKKTHTSCLNDLCRKIPTKGEINIMKSNGIDKEFVPERNCEIEGYRCLFCNYITETVEN